MLSRDKSFLQPRRKFSVLEPGCIALGLPSRAMRVIRIWFWIREIPKVHVDKGFHAIVGQREGFISKRTL